MVATHVTSTCIWSLSQSIPITYPFAIPLWAEGVLLLSNQGGGATNQDEQPLRITFQLVVTISSPSEQHHVDLCTTPASEKISILSSDITATHDAMVLTITFKALYNHVLFFKVDMI